MISRIGDGSKRKLAVTVPAAILLLVLYILIFGFSSQDAEQSGSLSLWISEGCVQLLNTLAGGHWSRQFMDGMALYFEHPLRKLAHFGEYACMGTLLFLIWSPWLERGKILYRLIIGWVFVSAVLDEFHQWFVPGRYSSFADVCLDTCGGVFGLLFCLLLVNLRVRRKNRKNKRKGRSGE